MNRTSVSAVMVFALCVGCVIMAASESPYRFDSLVLCGISVE